MKERFNSTINSIIVSSILALVIGLIMVFFPAISVNTIGIMVSVFIILHGIVLVYMDFKAAQHNVPYDGLLSGIISILLGALLLCKPSLVSVMLVFIIGIWILLSSINNIRIAVNLSKTDLPWVFILLLGILDLFAGIIVIFNPFEATISLTLFSGIMIIVHSVINIVDMTMLKKDATKISEELDKIVKKHKIKK